MPDDYVDEDGRIRWIERHEALAPTPVRDERHEGDDEDGDDEGEEGDGVRAAPGR
jgi:hypothetical protein